MKKEEFTIFDLEKLLEDVRSASWYQRVWWDIEEFFIYCFSIKRWIRRIKFFCQRRIRGFDDSETWNLDITFFNWLLPRLKRFNSVNGSYPDDRGSFENWEKEINEKITQLEYIINNDIYGANDYEKEVNDFLTWFKDNIRHLWW